MLSGRPKPCNSKMVAFETIKGFPLVGGSLEKKVASDEVIDSVQG